MLTYTFRERVKQWLMRDNDRVRDTGLFHKLNEMASETFVDNVINGDLFTLSADLDDLIRLSEFKQALRRIENRYLNAAVRRRAEALARELDNLQAFTSRTFSSVGGHRVKFYPDPIDSKVYDSEHAKLKAHIGVAWDAYSAYREAVKDHLRI